MAEPAATPTETADDSQVIASVRRPGGACRSIRLKPAISVGAMARPEKKMTRASDRRPGSDQNVATPATVTHRVIANRRSSGARHDREPYQMPPVALPSAYVPSRK